MKNCPEKKTLPDSFFITSFSIMATGNFTIKEIKQKLEYYCSYQERCHAEVNTKLATFTLTTQEKEQIIVWLIENNFLNEERFCQLFVNSKLNQKLWGKNRIKAELKARNISDFLISKQLKEIDEDNYAILFETIAEKTWLSIKEKNKLKKRKKFCDTLLRKGWETHKIYEIVDFYEKNT